MADYDWFDYPSPRACCGHGPHGVWCNHKMTQAEWDKDLEENGSIPIDAIPGAGECKYCRAIVMKESYVKHWYLVHNKSSNSIFG